MFLLIKIGFTNVTENGFHKPYSKYVLRVLLKISFPSVIQNWSTSVTRNRPTNVTQNRLTNVTQNDPQVLLKISSTSGTKPKNLFAKTASLKL